MNRLAIVIVACMAALRLPAADSSSADQPVDLVEFGTLKTWPRGEEGQAISRRSGPRLRLMRVRESEDKLYLVSGAARRWFRLGEFIDVEAPRHLTAPWISGSTRIPPRASKK